ncbi:AI-2E family transporter [Billgrantia diversa]|uniref:AI-2E family transporter n=1 Tax=Halomonas sp. MCCC 1A13316 TaxID=2733487 RepID=UPI0018A57F5D|nr:AI-2E family transporter [Halomonas sp. MCCC 1A13316]QOR39560.1 AI-2E family transporter [Halomonas sp. MCCC 1A13316]
MIYRDDNVRYGRPLTLTLALAALVVIIAGIRAGADLIIPILLGLFIAVICTSPVNWLHRLGLGQRLAVVVTLLVIGGGLSLVGLLAVNAFGTFIEALPGIEGRLYDQYLNLLDSMASMGLAINPDTLAGLVEVENEEDWFSALLEGLGNLLMQSVVVALLVIFMLFETLNFRRKVAHALDDPAASLQRFHEFSQTLKRYLAVKTFVSLATGVMAWLACMVAGVDFPLLWGVLAFALNYIPNIGSAIAAVPPVLLLLVAQGGGLLPAFGLAMAYLAINFVLGNLVEPRLMGRALGLSAFVAFLSLVVWGWLLGVVGMLLSVVLTMTLKIALDSHPQTRWMAYLLGPGKRPLADSAVAKRERWPSPIDDETST